MTTLSSIDREKHWSGHPLCRRYLAATFDTVTLQLPDGRGAREIQVQWGIGYVDDRESEVLGVWFRSNSAATSTQITYESDPLDVWVAPAFKQPIWRMVFSELRDRGVERIRFAICGDMRSVREDLRAKFPGAIAVPSFSRLIDRSVAPVATRHRGAEKDR